MKQNFSAAPLNLAGKKIWVAGHRGMVGSAVVRALEQEHCEILSVPHAELDLRSQEATMCWMQENKPEIVVIAAAKVGGIGANSTYPAEFLYDNLMIEANIIHAAYQTGVEKLLCLGSSCIYPKFSEQPIEEDALLSGALEPTNEPYAIAKIAGLKLCEAYRRQYGCNFISAMPCNLYGPGDHYDLENSHVIPAMLMKFHHARQSSVPEVVLWGTGRPLREFLHVEDLAAGLVHLLKHYNGLRHVNVGSGEEISIHDLAKMVADVVNYRGKVVFDSSKPDGTPRKLLDNRFIFESGWQPKVSLKNGLVQSYEDYLERLNVKNAA